jgi:hypothetical protein
MNNTTVSQAPASRTSEVQSDTPSREPSTRACESALWIAAFDSQSVLGGDLPVVKQSAAVAELDAVLNRRVIEARADGELDHALRQKTNIKRRLAAVPDSKIDTAAQGELERLNRCV